MKRFDGKYRDLGYIVENGQIMSSYRIYDYGKVTNRKIEIANGSSNKNYVETDLYKIIENIINGKA